MQGNKEKTHKSAIHQAMSSLILKNGLYLEFGVFDAHSFNIVRKINRKRGQGLTCIGFDTFEGLPSTWYTEDGQEVTKMDKFSLNGRFPEVGEAKLYKGLFADTIPFFLEDQKNNSEYQKPLSLLMIDGDLYESAIDVLFGLNHLIIKDTIIVFDEWSVIVNGENRKNGEERACQEWCTKFGRAYEEISGDFNIHEFESKIMKILI